MIDFNGIMVLFSGSQTELRSRGNSFNEEQDKVKRLECIDAYTSHFLADLNKYFDYAFTQSTPVFVLINTSSFVHFKIFFARFNSFNP